MAMLKQQGCSSGERFASRQLRGRRAGLAAPSRLAAARGRFIERWDRAASACCRERSRGGRPLQPQLGHQLFNPFELPKTTRLAVLRATLRILKCLQLHPHGKRLYLNPLCPAFSPRAGGGAGAETPAPAHLREPGQPCAGVLCPCPWRGAGPGSCGAG